MSSCKFISSKITPCDELRNLVGDANKTITKDMIGTVALLSYSRSNYMPECDVVVAISKSSEPLIFAVCPFCQAKLK